MKELKDLVTMNELKPLRDLDFLRYYLPTPAEDERELTNRRDARETKVSLVNVRLGFFSYTRVTIRSRG